MSNSGAERDTAATKIFTKIRNGLRAEGASSVVAAAYQPYIENFFATQEGVPHISSPRNVAEVVYRAVLANDDRTDYVAGRDAAFLVLMKRLLPQATFARLRLGIAAWGRGSLDLAEELLGAALAQFRALGATWGTATALASLGDVARARADWGRVAQLCAEALRGYRRLQSTWYVASSLAALGGALGMLGEDERAAQLHGASAALFETIGMELHDLDRAEYAAGFAAARGRLGEAAYVAAYNRGRSLSYDDLVV